MGRITARIALLAYVVGGWFLPAIHHHGPSCDHGAVSHSTIVAVETEIAWASAHQCCDHDHCHVSNEIDHNVDPVDLAVHPGHSHVSDVGLCALCSARSLTATPTFDLAYLSSETCLGESPGICCSGAPLAVILGSHSPRGPPATV